jgi:dTDP-4-dehydrorhamnose reductase
MIWLCGSKGMLGKHFFQLFQERKIAFISTSREQLDICDLDAVLAFAREHRPTHLINCAAYTQVDKAETERELAFQVNALGPKNLAIAAQELKIPIVHFSTDYVFDGLATLPYSEEHPSAPINHYGLTKMVGERLLLDHAEKGCLIRTSWLFGEQGKHFVGTILRLLQEKETLRVVADQVGRPTYCHDLAEATLELMDHPGIFHYANSGETSWCNFAKEISRQWQEAGLPHKTQTIVPITTQEYPTPARRPAYSSLATKKMEATTGRAPRPWQEALTHYMKRRVSNETRCS